eukprot:scaffold108263_cov63-Phaeocystis_antarctica.AAC.1
MDGITGVHAHHIVAKRFSTRAGVVLVGRLLGEHVGDVGAHAPARKQHRGRHGRRWRQRGQGAIGGERRAERRAQCRARECARRQSEHGARELDGGGRGGGEEGELRGAVGALAPADVHERELGLLQHGEGVGREDGGERAVEDAVEDQRPDEGEEGAHAAAIQGARERDEHARFRCARAREGAQRVADGGRGVERVAQRDDVLEGGVDAQAEVRLDAVHGVAQEHGRGATVQPRRGVTEERQPRWLLVEDPLQQRVVGDHRRELRQQLVKVRARRRHVGQPLREGVIGLDEQDAAVGAIERR